MDVSDASFERLLALTYQCLEEPGAWRHLYDRLCDAVGAASVHMLGIDSARGMLSYSDGANLLTQGELAYMQKYHAIDPRVPLVIGRRVHQWTHCHEDLDEDFVARDPFYQEFLLPHERRYMSATKLLEDGGATVILSTLRTKRQGPLPPAAVQFLDRLLPHLSRACRIGLQNFASSTHALVGHLMVDKLRQPVILMHPGGDVMHTNVAAQRLLQSTGMVKIVDRKLQLPPEYASAFLGHCMALERGVRVLEADAHRARGEQFHSMHMVWRDPATGQQETLYAFFSLLMPQASMGVFGLRPVVMLLFYHPQSAPVIDASLLYAVFGLTPAESRVAIQLAQGLTLKDIARLFGTQPETVRKQLKSIYGKTSTNRQPDLVRLLLHLPPTVVQG